MKLASLPQQGLFAAPHESGSGPSRRFRYLRYFRFGWEQTLVNRMPDECKITTTRLAREAKTGEAFLSGRGSIRDAAPTARPGAASLPGSSAVGET
jgi:hypothetical protein